MASGGARARSGPAPDPNALRQNGEWTDLPPRRVGDTPAWPLPMQSDRESAMWSALWEKPQAILWERDQLVELVALYVRRFVEAEVPDSPVSLSTLVRQMASELMLTSDGLARQRYRVSRVESKAAKSPPATRAGGARSRLTVVRDDSN